jgi:hypothetical protein
MVWIPAGAFAPSSLSFGSEPGSTPLQVTIPSQTTQCILRNLDVSQAHNNFFSIEVDPGQITGSTRFISFLLAFG